MIILKILLLLTAGATVVLRLFVSENAAFVSPETVKLLNIISIVSACICIVCALIWVVLIKLDEKKKKSADKKK